MTTIPVPTPEPLLDLDRARQLLAAAELDAIAVHSLESYFYLSGLLFFDRLAEPDAAAFAVLPVRPDAPAGIGIPMAGRYMLEDFPVWPPLKIFYGRFYIKGGPTIEGETAADEVDALARALGEAGAAAGRVGFELDQL